MADTEDDTQTLPDYSAASPEVKAALLNQPASGGGVDLGSIAQQLMQQPTLPQPDRTPVSRGWLSLLGEALGGGTMTDVMSPGQKETAGLRALRDFGTSLIAGSGYYPGKPALGAFAEGFQGAERSQRGSEEGAAAYLAAQQQYAAGQQQQYLERLKVAVPLLRAGAAGAVPNLLLGGGAVPGTSGGAGGGGYEGSIAGIEGTGKNKNSSASGVGQFLDSTWSDFAAANPDLFKGMTPAQVMAAKSDPGLGAKAITWLAQRNAGVLSGAGATPTGQSLGIAHYIGPTAAAKVMAAPDNAPVSSFVSPDAVQANKEIAAGLTVGQLKQRYAKVPDPGFLAPPKPVKVAGPGAPTGGATAPDVPWDVPAGGEAATPPADATAPATATPVPAAPLSFADFQKQNPIPTTPEEQATLDALQRVKQQTAVELQNAPTTGVDRVKTVQAAREAADNLATATRQIQDAHTAHQVALYNAEMTRRQGDERAAADRAAQIALKEQEGKQAITLANVQGDVQRATNKEQVINTANLEGLKTAQKEQGEARDVVSQLQGFRAISDGVGQPNWLQTTKLPGSEKTIAETLGQLGMPLSDTGGVQLLRGGINNLVKTLRQGMSMGSLSDRDLNFIERMGPTEWMDQDTRTAAVAYLQQAYQAKQRFTSDVQKEMARGKNYGDAIDAADAKQKPFVPAVPADLSAHWTDNSPEWRDRRIQWAQQNEVHPGTLYHLSNGSIMVMKSPRAQQGQQ